MAVLITQYELGEGNVVKRVQTNNGSDYCLALLNEDGKTYTFSSKLDDDKDEKVSPTENMSLADCILASHVLLGLIPPHNFDPIACPNAHG